MSLSNWNKNNILKLSIDHKHVDTALIDFPLLLNLSDTSGKNNYNCSSVFNELCGTNFQFDEFENGSLGYKCVGTNMDLASENLWLSTVNNSGQHLRIYNNTLSFDGNDTGNTGTGTSSVYSEFRLGGDFQVQCDLVVQNTTGYYSIYFYLNDYSGHWHWLGLGDGSSIARSFIYRDEVTSIISVNTTTSTNVKLRYTRTGTTLSYHYSVDDGATWLSTGLPSPKTVGSESCRIGCRKRADETKTFSPGYFDNIEVVYGDIEDVEGNTYYNYRKKLAVVYPSVQEHWVETVNDSFTSDVPNPLLWDTTLPITSGRLERLDTTSVTDSVYASLQYSFVNDFDIQMDVFRLNDNSGEKFMLMCGRVYFEFFYDKLELLLYNAGYSVLYTNSVSIALTQAKLKFIRKGTTFSFFYHDGSSWIEIGLYDDTTDQSAGVTATPTLRFNKGTSSSYRVAVDNYRVNSGEIDWEGNTINKELKSYIHGEQEQLFCEIERWDQASTEAQLWVKVPKVLSNQPTDLLLYYDKEQEDNESYVGDTSSWPAQQVWDNNFIAVYHMSQDPSEGGACILDSTSNINHGTPNGSMTSEDVVNGQVGKALDFDGVDDRVIIPYTSMFNYTNGITLEILVDFNRVIDNYSYFIRQQNSSDPWAGFAFSYENRDSMSADPRYRVNRIYYNEDNSTNKVDVHGSDGTLVAGFTALTSTYNNLNVLLYEEGTQVSEEVLGDLDFNSIEDIAIGGNISGVGLLDGIVDEVRISNVPRPSSWIKATYNSNIDNLTTIQKADVYQTSGYVTELGLPVQRSLFLYDRVSGELMDKTVSTSSGYYFLNTTVSGVHNVVCQDAGSEPDFDDLIISKIVPVEVV